MPSRRIRQDPKIIQRHGAPVLLPFQVFIKLSRLSSRADDHDHVKLILSGGLGNTCGPNQSVINPRTTKRLGGPLSTRSEIETPQREQGGD